MMPNPNAASARSLSRYDRLDQGADPFPRVTFEFQPRRFGGFSGGGGLPWRRPGFSGLAKQVLAAEASRSFRLETAILGFVTLVTAWPIAAMLREVIRLLK
jgi:hypothetical protein